MMVSKSIKSKYKVPQFDRDIVFPQIFDKFLLLLTSAIATHFSLKLEKSLKSGKQIVEWRKQEFLGLVLN